MSFHKKIKNIDLEEYNHNIQEYDQSWQSCDQYAYNVLTEKIITNKHVKMTCARYIYDRTRQDLEFRTEEITQAIKFTNLLKHIKGPISGQPMLLQQWQIFIIGNLLGFYFVAGDRNGERRFNKALCLVARGNSKTTLSAVLSLLFMTNSPNGSPSVFSAARTRSQAALSFQDTKKMIAGADFSLSSLFNIQAHEIHGVVNDSLFRPLASEAQSVDGLRSALNVVDELASHHNGEMLSTLITGTSATKDPLTFCISTAGIQLDGVCIHERNLCRDINAGIEIEDSQFGIEYCIDEEDEWDDETHWCKANPSLGHAVNINSLRSELARARQTSVNKTSFKTKYLNVFVNTNDSPFLDIEDTQKCAKSLDIRDYFGRECSLGLDLAQRFDLASLALLFPEDDGSMTVFLRNYCARGAMKKLTAAKYEMYNQWEEDGCLIVTNGNSTDFEYIKDDIRFAAKNFNLKMCGYDPYAGSQLAIDLESEGIEMVEVRQGYAQLSEPAKLLQTLVSDEKFNYDETDKCFEWCVSNSSTTEDKNGNIKVHKSIDKPHDKVDAVVAIITGLNPESLRTPKTKDPYHERGMITI